MNLVLLVMFLTTMQEIKVLSRLKHPNIVQYYGSEIVSDFGYAGLLSTLEGLLQIIFTN